MVAANRWWSGRRALALSLLALVLAACGGGAPSIAGVPRLDQLRATPTVAPAIATPAVTLDDQGFADPAFRALWQKTDGDAASGNGSRPPFWGPPVPNGARREPYAQSPGGTRLVQYFEKGRMEITDPSVDPNSEWYVSSGLLTAEMVDGQYQVTADSYQKLEPAKIPVVGDLESPSPQTPQYADYTTRHLTKVPDHTGQAVTTQLQRGGAESQINPPATVKVAAYDDPLGHNIADVFNTYFQKDLTGMGLNWLFVMGHPISEPYWVSAKVNGQPQVMLVQLFERRALAYNPAGKEGSQVEFTNIGLHYYRWRYHDRSSDVAPAAPVASGAVVASVAPVAPDDAWRQDGA